MHDNFPSLLTEHFPQFSMSEQFLTIIWNWLSAILFPFGAIIVYLYVKSSSGCEQVTTPDEVRLTMEEEEVTRV